MVTVTYVSPAPISGPIGLLGAFSNLRPLRCRSRTRTSPRCGICFTASPTRSSRCTQGARVFPRKVTAFVLPSAPAGQREAVRHVGCKSMCRFRQVFPLHQDYSRRFRNRAARDIAPRPADGRIASPRRVDGEAVGAGPTTQTQSAAGSTHAPHTVIGATGVASRKARILAVRRAHAEFAA